MALFAQSIKPKIRKYFGFFLTLPMVCFAGFFGASCGCDCEGTPHYCITLRVPLAEEDLEHCELTPYLYTVSQMESFNIYNWITDDPHDYTRYYLEATLSGICQTGQGFSKTITGGNCDLITTNADPGYLYMVYDNFPVATNNGSHTYSFKLALRSPCTQTTDNCSCEHFFTSQQNYAQFIPLTINEVWDLNCESDCSVCKHPVIDMEITESFTLCTETCTFEDPIKNNSTESN